MYPGGITMGEVVDLKSKTSLVRGLFTGAAAGLAGALMMDAFQELVARSGPAAGNEASAQKAHAPRPGEENTTEKTARQVLSQFGHPPSAAEKQRTGRALHYGFGFVMGALYGVANEYVPAVSLGAGTLFGTALFVATDEAVLPLLDLASKPEDTPPADHLLHWASHVVFATTLELARDQMARLA